MAETFSGVGVKANFRFFNELSLRSGARSTGTGVALFTKQIQRLASRGGRNTTSTVFRFWGVS